LQVHKNIQLSCHLSVDLVFYSNYVYILSNFGERLFTNDQIPTHRRHP